MPLPPHDPDTGEILDDATIPPSEIPALDDGVIAGLPARLAGIRLELNERLHVAAMAKRVAAGAAISGLDARYLVSIAQKYDVGAAGAEEGGGDAAPPLLTDADRARLTSAFSASNESRVGTAETPLPTLQEVKPCP
jgi:hypothetical protein